MRRCAFRSIEVVDTLSLIVGKLTTARLLAAASGVLLGHAVVYALPHTDGHAHDAVHGYLHLLAPLLAPFALVAIVRLTAAEARRPGRLRLPGLLALQATLFLVQEAGERLAIGSSLLGLVADPALWAGLGVQAVVAAALSLTVRVGGRVLRRIPSLSFVGLAVPDLGLVTPVASLRPAAAPMVTLRLRGPPARA